MGQKRSLTKEEKIKIYHKFFHYFFPLKIDVIGLLATYHNNKVFKEYLNEVSNAKYLNEIINEEYREIAEVIAEGLNEKERKEFFGICEKVRGIAKKIKEKEVEKKHLKDVNKWLYQLFKF
ncbi:hypothetical protein B6U82_00075 [Candidatus Pacearchaeota archaeon ex4484_31]|nr:MAG: hypothetical protein B6U82_00075 [Candidatus Pacearchaeota archaeon ex4484_31]